MVVGGGPAGLEAARVAAGRGHQVTVLERGPALGGQLRLAARAPGATPSTTSSSTRSTSWTLPRRRRAPGGRGHAEAGAGPRPRGGRVRHRVGSPGAAGARNRRRPTWSRAGTCWPDGPRWAPRVAVVSAGGPLRDPERGRLPGRGGPRRRRSSTSGCRSDPRSTATRSAAIMARLAHHGITVHTAWRLEAVEGRDPGAALGAHRRPAPTRRLRHRGARLRVGARHRRCTTSWWPRARCPRWSWPGSAWVPRLLAEATQHGAQVGLEI